MKGDGNTAREKDYTKFEIRSVWVMVLSLCDDVDIRINDEHSTFFRMLLLLEVCDEDGQPNVDIYIIQYILRRFGLISQISYYVLK